MADNSITWWTVPQAAVWIRTRDQKAAQSRLGPRETRSLTLADGAVPGAFEARRCLRAALERGRFTAYGRAARLEMATDTGKLRHRFLETDAQPIPEAFWQVGGDFEDSLDDDGVRAVVHGDPERWVRVVVDRDDCIGHWPAPRSVLGKGAVPLGHLIEDMALQAGAEDNWSWFLGHEDVIVTGLNANGERVRIDRQSLAMSSLTIDQENCLSLGSLNWSCVIVRLTPPPPVTRAPPPPPTLRGGLGPIAIARPAERPSDDAAAATNGEAAEEAAPTTLPKRAPIGRPSELQRKIAAIYPNGTEATSAEVVRQLKARQIYASKSTVERALGRRGDADRSRPKSVQSK